MLAGRPRFITSHPAQSAAAPREGASGKREFATVQGRRIHSLLGLVPTDGCVYTFWVGKFGAQ